MSCLTDNQELLPTLECGCMETASYGKTSVGHRCAPANHARASLATVPTDPGPLEWQEHRTVTFLRCLEGLT